MKKILMICFVTVFMSGCLESGGDEIYDSLKEARDIPNTIKPQPSDTVKEGDQAFEFQLLGQLNTGREENLVFSPYSISEALGMAYLGALGETKAEFDVVLGTLDLSEDEYKGAKKFTRQSLVDQEDIQLEVSNSIWTRQGFKPKDQYLMDTIEVFDAYSYELDFEDGQAVRTINDWIEKSTEGRIEKMLEGPIDDRAFMYLINTIYFNGQWKSPFKEKATKKMDFYNHNGDRVQTDFMRMKEDVDYYESNKITALYLPYEGNSTGMVFILPQEGIDIDQYISDFSEGHAGLEYILDGLRQESHVTIEIPKFKIESGPLFLIEDLKNLGLMAPFYSQTADFRGIYQGQDPLYISNIVHKAVFEIDEIGGRGAAATEVEVTKEEALEIEDPKSFVANRPFFFIVYDQETETILFMGKVKNF